MLYFALVSEGEAFDPITHAREDLEVFSLTISHDEGEFARAEIEIQNPRLALTDKRILISEDGTLVFDGYFTAVPRGALDETVDVEAVARPKDADDRIAALVATLKTAPHYDSLFVPEDAQDDPAEVLAGWGRVLAWPRTTHAVEAVDILGDGGAALTVEPFVGTVDLDITDSVPTTASLNVSVQWNQILTKSFDVGEFPIETMTPDGVIDNWPKIGSELSSGFRVIRSEIRAGQGGVMDAGPREVKASRAVSSDELDPAFEAEGAFDDKAEIVSLYGALTVQSRHELRRKETASLSLDADVQPVLNSSAEDVEEIALRDITQNPGHPAWSDQTDYLVGDIVIRGVSEYQARENHHSGRRFDEDRWNYLGEASYITSRSVSSFFNSTRGQEAAEHMKARLEARLRYLSRAVQVSCSCEMPDLALIGHHSLCTIQDPRIPGGSATGRVVSYSLQWSGGARTAGITIACAAGNGVGASVAISADTAPETEHLVSVSFDASNLADEQEPQFVSNGEISPSSVVITPNAPAAKDYSFSFLFSADGPTSFPKQIDLTGTIS